MKTIAYEQPPVELPLRTDPDCQWTAAPTGDADVCMDMCIGHTGRTGHMTFLREFSEVAVVERAQ
ncbi:hypothetical protein [Streptomyces griseoaurantiacus]|uniref:hypothetical protein n=1 Tax=Streptomyces griseoaurantiacus TaxID=68213 RepID=UPI002E2D951E|nr:hypothetical protein [Streptomyces jietaisiensis]